jgi:hypothetical protein
MLGLLHQKIQLRQQISFDEDYRSWWRSGTPSGVLTTTVKRYLLMDKQSVYW